LLNVYSFNQYSSLFWLGGEEFRVKYTVFSNS
jgi:hypothetical protein